jgi:hypothetical protein
MSFDQREDLGHELVELLGSNSLARQHMRFLSTAEVLEAAPQKCDRQW